MNTRSISGMERAMLRFGETMGADLVIGRVTGTMDAVAFQAAAAAVVRRHPSLRVRVEGRPPARFIYARPEDASVHTEVISEAAADAWQAAAQRETTRPFALDGGPACRFVLVIAAGVAHVIIAAPHAIVDGRSLLRLLDDLLTAWAAATRGESAALPELPVTPAAHTLVRRPLLFRLAAPLLRRVWMSGLRAYQARPPLRPRAQVRRAEDVSTRVVFREGTPEGWSRLRAACKHHGVTVGGAFLAATWFALARLIADDTAAPPTRLILDLDVDLRARMTPAAPDTHVGFYTGLAQLGGRAPASTDFWTLARRLRGETVRNLQWGVPELTHLLPHEVADFYEHVEQRGASRHAAGGSSSLVSVSNVGRFPYPSDRGPLRLTGLWGMNGAFLLGPTLITWLRFVDDRMFYNAVGSAPAVDQEQLVRFEDAIFQLLEDPPEALSIAEFCKSPHEANRDARR